MSNSPLPCPFCGAAPRVKVWPNDPYNLRGCVEVSCENNYCPVQASAEENSIEAATANWNARVTLAPEGVAQITIRNPSDKVFQVEIDGKLLTLHANEIRQLDMNSGGEKR